jgi:hypothetical protein
LYNTRSILLQSLANTISDYRQNEIAPITPAHIERWLGQFDPKDQPVILSEMDSIMKRFYFSKVRVKEHVRTFLKEHIVGTQDPMRLLPHVGFLNIQKRGTSQKAMLNIVDEILREEYRLALLMTGTGEVQTYVYIDDCIYTASRLRYDLTDGRDSFGWLSTCSASRCRLWVYTIAGHNEGIDYVRTYVRHAAQEKDIKLNRITDLIINNTRAQGSNIEVLWPENVHNPYVDSYYLIWMRLPP